MIRIRGKAELYHPDCVEGRKQRGIRWMLWAGVSGKYGKGNHLFWNKKDWGNINSTTYYEHTVPLIYEYLDQHNELYLMQDSCSGHALKQTRQYIASIGILPMQFPSRSPDLNPIKTVWDWMKEYIHNKYPKTHRSYKRLQDQVTEAWLQVDNNKVKELVHTMLDRVAAVIATNDWHTKF